MEDGSTGTSSGIKLLSAVGVLVITVVYLWFEVRYNRGLLNLFSQPHLSQQAIDDLSLEGKVLASLGLVWALLRNAIARIADKFLRVAVFAAAAGATYVGLSAIYDHVIRNLSPATKVDGFHLFAFRQALIEGNVVDPDVPLPASYGAIGSVFMVCIPLVLFSDRYLVPARLILELRAKTIEDYYWKKVDAGWIRYQTQMRFLSANYQQYLDGSRRVEVTPAFFQSRARNQFVRESGGLNPNSRASINDFLGQLSRISSPAASQYRAAEEEVIFIDREGTPAATAVRGRDLPKFMNREQFRNFFSAKIQGARIELLPTVHTVEKTARIDDINSSVFIPPMAMATSVLSILANAFNAVWILLTLPFLVIPRLANGRTTRVLTSLAPYLTVGVIALAFVMMPRFVFPDNTPMQRLEENMQARLQTAGVLWSRTLGLQTWLFRNTGFVRRG